VGLIGATSADVEEEQLHLTPHPQRIVRSVDGLDADDPQTWRI
jgi:hypothetical protein